MSVYFFDTIRKPEIAVKLSPKVAGKSCVAIAIVVEFVHFEEKFLLENNVPSNLGLNVSSQHAGHEHCYNLKITQRLDGSRSWVFVVGL